MRKTLWVFTSLLILIASVGLVRAWGTNQPVACDFVTGGGFIVGGTGDSLPSGAHGNFGVGGGVKNGAFWGHLEYNDHGTAPTRQIHGTGVCNYQFVDPTTRDIFGTCQDSVTGACSYRVRVNDKGEPGINNDEFTILVCPPTSGCNTSCDSAAALYKAGKFFDGNPIRGGNIQLHKGNASNTPPPNYTCQTQ